MHRYESRKVPWLPELVSSENPESLCWWSWKSSELNLTALWQWRGEGRQCGSLSLSLGHCRQLLFLCRVGFALFPLGNPWCISETTFQAFTCLVPRVWGSCPLSPFPQWPGWLAGVTPHCGMAQPPFALWNVFDFISSSCPCRFECLKLLSVYCATGWGF